VIKLGIRHPWKKESEYPREGYLWTCSREFAGFPNFLLWTLTTKGSKELELEGRGEGDTLFVRTWYCTLAPSCTTTVGLAHFKPTNYPCPRGKIRKSQKLPCTCAREALLWTSTTRWKFFLWYEYERKKVLQCVAVPRTEKSCRSPFFHPEKMRQNRTLPIK